MKVQLLSSVGLVLLSTAQGVLSEESSLRAHREAADVEEMEDEDYYKDLKKLHKYGKHYKKVYKHRKDIKRFGKCYYKDYRYCQNEMMAYCEGNWCDAFEFVDFDRLDDAPGIYVDAVEAVYLKMMKDIADGEYVVEEED